MPPLPSPVRAALGFAVTVLDEARHLPDKAIELPMRAVSTALKLSLRAQQRYAELAARGDDVLAGRRTTDAPPDWATFDDPIDSVADDHAGDADVTPVRRPRPTPVKPVPAAKSSARSRPAAKTARTTKTVRAPRTGKASAFDNVIEDE